MISIIVPVYNGEKFLRDTTESILNQTYKNFEIVFVDDGSTDKSREIIRKYGQEYSCVKEIYTNNKGISMARNYGIEFSVGEWIIFFNAGDVMDKDYLKQISYVLETGCDLIIGAEHQIDKNRVEAEVSTKQYSDGLYNKDDICLLMDINPYSGTKCYNRKKIMENSIRFADVKIGQDLDFYLKYLYYCTNVCVNSRIKCGRRILSDNTNNPVDRKILEIMYVYQDVEESLPKSFQKNALYCKALQESKIKNYRIQFLRYIFVDNIKERKEVFTKLAEAIIELRPDCSDAVAQTRIMDTENKYRKKWVYLSPLYIRYRRFKWKHVL